jgi:hypothetical protein
MIIGFYATFFRTDSLDIAGKPRRTGFAGLWHRFRPAARSWLVARRAVLADWILRLQDRPTALAAGEAFGALAGLGILALIWRRNLSLAAIFPLAALLHLPELWWFALQSKRRRAALAAIALSISAAILYVSWRSYAGLAASLPRFSASERKTISNAVQLVLFFTVGFQISSLLVRRMENVLYEGTPEDHVWRKSLATLVFLPAFTCRLVATLGACFSLVNFFPVLMILKANGLGLLAGGILSLEIVFWFVRRLLFRVAGPAGRPCPACGFRGPLRVLSGKVRQCPRCRQHFLTREPRRPESKLQTLFEFGFLLSALAVILNPFLKIIGRLMGYAATQEDWD